MSVAVVETVRRLPFAPAELAELVGDVRSYPAFLPWVQRIEVLNREAVGVRGWRGLARAEIGWRSIRERFATYVDCRPEEGAVDVRLAEGPFKRLENRWRFTAADGGTLVTFWIAYEFKNRILQALAAANRERAAERIIAAFEAEARRRLAPQANLSGLELTS